MTSITSALEEAAWVYEHRDNYDLQQRFDAAASLAQWGVFSLRQVGAIVRLSHTTVAKVARAKQDKTGGKFSPECLPLLFELQRAHARGEGIAAADVAAMVDAGSGTSFGFAARLAGISETQLRRRYTQAKEASP